MYTLIYFLSFYDIEGQKRSANDIDIKKKDSLSGRPSKESGKGIRARARVGACEGEIRKVPFLSLSPSPTEIPFLSLLKAYRAGQGRDSKRLELLSARLISKKTCEHVELSARGWCPNYIGRLD